MKLVLFGRNNRPFLLRKMLSCFENWQNLKSMKKFREKLKNLGKCKDAIFREKIRIKPCFKTPF